jgi:hypothetical protein
MFGVIYHVQSKAEQLLYTYTFRQSSKWQSAYSAKLWCQSVRPNHPEIFLSEFLSFPLWVLIQRYSNLFLYDVRYSVQILAVWLNKTQQSPTEISTGYTLISEHRL